MANEIILRTVLIAFVIGAMVVSGFSIFLMDMTSLYGETIDGNITELYSEMNSTLFNADTVSNDMQESIEGSEGVGSSGGEILATGKILNVALLPFELLKSSMKALTLASTYLGLPSWAFAGFLAIITIIIVMVIFSTIIRMER